MMEREFVAQKLKEYQIQEFVDVTLGNVGHSHTVMKKTPLGEKIVIYSSRPGLVVGRRGTNIKDLTKLLKKQFNLENPQVEISEVENVYLDPHIVAEKIATSLERFGTNRFKGIGHKTMEKIMESGARGVEIIMSGKIPGARARSWRFYQGYVKKCGEAAQLAVRKATRWALLKPGIIGIRVSIMPPGVRLPDDIRKREQPAVVTSVVAPEDGKESGALPEKKEDGVEKTEPADTGKKSKKKSAPRKKKTIPEEIEVKENENKGATDTTQ